MRRLHRSLLVVGIVLWAHGTCIGAPGDLDTSFGTSGIVTTELIAGEIASTGRAVEIQADGKVLVCSDARDGSVNDLGILRYNSDGTPDIGFGVDGRVVTSIAVFDSCKGINVLPDGKIRAMSWSDNSFAIVGYNPDGSPDNTFGPSPSNNRSSFNIGLLDPRFPSNSVDIAEGMAQQPDGRMVLVGYTRRNTPAFVGVVRSNPDGTPDTTFDDDGALVEQITFNTISDRGKAVAIQPDGKIIVAGEVWTQNNPNKETVAFVMRLNADGSLDDTFGDLGGYSELNLNAINELFDVVLQPDGKILVAGQTDDKTDADMMLLRYNSDGTLDTTFDTDGIVTTSVSTGSGFNFDKAHSIALQTDGKILLAGHDGLDFVVARYNEDGSLDAGFGTGGIVITNLGASFDFAYAMALQPDGQIVVVGSTNDGTGSHLAIVRYEGSTPPAMAPDIAVTDPVAPANDLQIPFGSVTAAAAANATVTIGNAGNADLTLGQIAQADGLAAPFSILADTCSNQPVLPAGSCTLTVRFSPDTVGSFSDTFDIPSDDPDTGTVTVSVSGTGTVTPVPDIEVTDSMALASDLQMAFPDTTTGVTSAAGTVTVANTGTAALNVSVIQLAGADAGEFVLDAGGGASPCSSTAPTLAAGGSCTVSITFQPAAIGTKSATLEITSDDVDESTVTVNLSGTGLAAGPDDNNPPTAAQLISPVDGQTVARDGSSPPSNVFPNSDNGQLLLRWKPATDPDGDPVTYEVFYCSDPDPFTNCTPTQVAHMPPAGAGPERGRSNPGNQVSLGWPAAGSLAVLIGAGAIATLLLVFGGVSKRRRWFAFYGVPMVAAGLLVASCGSNSNSDDMTLRTVGLSRNTTYYWGVMTEDDRGGATQSEVWRFTTK